LWLQCHQTFLLWLYPLVTFTVLRYSWNWSDNSDFSNLWLDFLSSACPCVLPAHPYSHSQDEVYRRQIQGFLHLWVPPGSGYRPLWKFDINLCAAQVQTLHWYW
jgi:hypothetical protein